MKKRNPTLDNTPTFQKSKTFLLSAGHLVNDSYNGFLAPILPLLMAKFNWSLAVTASLATVLSVTSSLTQPIHGYLSDRFPSRYFVILGPLLTASFMSFIGIAPSYQAFVMLLIFSGIGTSMFHPPAATMVARCSGNRQGWGMSIFVTGGTLGVAIGPIIISSLVKWLGLSYSPVTIIPGLVIVSLLFLYAPDVHCTQIKETATGENEGRISKNLVIYISLLALIAIVRAISISSFTNLSPLYLTEQGFSQEYAGFSVSFLLLFGGIGSFLGGPISDWFGRKRMMLLTLALAVPCGIGFLHFDNWLKFVFLGGTGFFLSASLPVTIIMAQELIPKHSSTVSSLMMGFCWGIAGFFLTLLGALGDIIGLERVFEGLILIPLIAVLLLLPLPSVYKP